MFHILEPVPNWLDAVKILPPGALVKATSVQWLSEARAANPGVFTVLRYVNDKIQDVNTDDTEEVRENRARDWIDRSIDGTFLDGATSGIPHWKTTDCISWWNEYYANSQSFDEKKLFILQERAAARVWMNEYRNGPHRDKLGHIRLSICATAVGNDIPLDSAATAMTYDCVVDYHGYDKFIAPKERDPLSWQFHAGRWATMDERFRAAGHLVDWINGEFGPYDGSDKGGWRSQNTLCGDVGLYIDAIRTVTREIKTTRAYNDGRMKGFAVFTTGGNWDNFDTNTPELLKIADVIREEWHTGPVPPAPSPLFKMRVTAIPWLNLRNGPGTLFDTVGRLVYGSEFTPVAKFTVGANEIWAQVSRDPIVWAAEYFYGKTYLKDV